MSQEIDDFTIFVPELTDMATCGLKMCHGLDRLWRMVERTARPYFRSASSSRNHWSARDASSTKSVTDGGPPESAP